MKDATILATASGASDKASIAPRLLAGRGFRWAAIPAWSSWLVRLPLFQYFNILGQLELGGEDYFKKGADMGGSGNVVGGGVTVTQYTQPIRHF